MERLLLCAAGALGFLSVALGAFGAHGLRLRLADAPDLAQRLDWWKTAASYHQTHALALALAAYLSVRKPALGAWAGGAFGLGVLLFSGSLYAMAWTGIRPLGAVTPLGGLGFLVGWTLVAVAAWQLPAGP